MAELKFLFRFTPLNIFEQIVLTPNDCHTEARLLQELKSGSEAAFTGLYNRYHQGIYAYLLDFVKVPQLAEDLVHEVFMKIWEARERMEITVSFSAYLYRISHNKAIDALKKIAKDATLRKEVLEWMDPHFIEFESEDKRLNHYEELYRNAVAALTPQRQKIFILCKEKGKTYEEAAMELGISRNTVKDHMVQSLRFLRNYFAEKGQPALIVIILGKFF
ncbi:RNA polymerase sigma-70 factor [Agriterribacter sp.]|uniref:RNA polymerase sigma factor n=1 Tax=Agriterribacter sp. TaxID=2821509 RepID=UPI002BF478BE|nr:RNA polymerase sigma-70 factor [Agriterribacter sp.]HRO44753.1 RNA polymerase sigma-70 factor [Agriterribacter sp.]HRQ16426.1 RNA polymerase sigma-70 factor [Agriterribacter sp.]